LSDVKVATRRLSLWYGDKQALKEISLEIPPNKVTSLIGPSGCGKSTFLRCLNRMNDLIDGVRIEGEVRIDDVNIYGKGLDVVDLRRKVGMVFQKSNPFPKTIFDNIAYGPRVNGMRGKRKMQELVEESARRAAIWDEIKDRLHESALSLSGGQQQRLCIARALAVNPDILLMDEPASALDPISTAEVEETIHELKELYTVVIVTHNMQQAARVADYTAYFYLGELVEFAPTQILFTNPRQKSTEDYITGRFG
jgi:phosphate transport system ATP-binding protein